MAGEYVFELERVSKFAGKTAILDDVTLSFFFGAKIGVIGPNGSGKSSLLRVLAGEDTDISGTARRAPRARIGHLEQEPRLDPEHTVAQAVEEGAAAARAVLDRYDQLCAKLGETLSPEETSAVNEEYDRIQNLIDANDLWNLDGQIQQAMDALRLPPDDAKIRVLSGGERRRVALCRLLLSNPDVLLLDEPTNHLDAESVDWLEQYLQKFPGTIICVTHDRYFLSRVTEWILELDQGRALPFKGNYESWLEQRQAMFAREQKQQASRRRLLERELEWVRMSAGARHSRNLARLKRYEELAAQEVDTREEEVQIQIPAGPRLGDLVVRAENLSFGYGDRLLMEHVNFDLPRGGIVGVIGGNGAGKTTLFRMILGQELPLSGALRVGESVVPAHVDQMRDALNPEATVYEEVCLGRDTVDLGGHTMNGRAY
ncbi:MAG: ATP-binding cassette domain-containing protein, partial [Kiritimatiellae bacterium]|nr:ATP-binding cassette domain-containing protein [Kiritimatiellia bacterium]